MRYFDEEYKNVQDGDELLTRSHLGKSERKVLYKNECVYLQGHWFRWDNFFEVNDYVRKL